MVKKPEDDDTLAALIAALKRISEMEERIAKLERGARRLRDEGGPRYAAPTITVDSACPTCGGLGWTCVVEDPKTCQACGGLGHLMTGDSSVYARTVD